MQTTHDNNQTRLLIEANVILPMDIQRVPQDDIALIFTTSSAEQQGNSGHVYVKVIGEKEATLQLTEQAGDYSPPICTQQGDTMWVINTEYANANRRLLLHSIRDNFEVNSRILVELAKIDNPHFFVCEGKIHIVWEDYSSGDAEIKYARYASNQVLVGDSSPEIPPLTVTPCKSYKPRLTSDGQQLYLFYEWFYHDRYRLMVRSLGSGKNGGFFSKAIEVGNVSGNDQAVSLAVQRDKVVAVWENSSPLNKGYEWISPKSHKVIIPNFGHGWRVNTKMCIRRIQYINQEWSVEDLVTAPGHSIDTQEAAGAPRVFVDGNTLFVSYLRWDYGTSSSHRGWLICTKVFDGDRWISCISPKLIQKQRVRPAVLLDKLHGYIHVFGQSPEREKAHWSDWTQENVATYQTTQTSPQLPYKHSAVFMEKRREQITKSVCPEPKHSTPYVVSFEDGKRQLLWGDLHMHSNLSGCSLGSRFHCTELEDKLRFCRDVANLDFALNTDHDSMSDTEWHRNRNAAHFHNFPGHFVAFNGFEWTCSHFNDKPNYGHYNILYKEDGPMLRTKDECYNTVMQLADKLPHESILAIPHHPGDSTHPLDWNAFNPDFAPLVEIFQVRGSYEYDNCPMHPEMYGRKVVRKHSLQYGLNRGFDFGFTSGGEHEGVGVTGVYAEEFSRKGIFNALQERRTYGTTGDRIIVDFRLDQHPIGSCIHTSAQTMTGYLMVLGTDILTYIKIVKNGSIVHEWNPGTLQIKHFWQEKRLTDSFVPGKRDYYYIVVNQSNNEMAWTSPIFVYGE
jgi:hypothetical protein